MEDMAESPEVDVERIMEQIRENVRKRQQRESPSDDASPPPSDGASPPPPEPVLEELTALHCGYALYPLHFTSHRRGVGLMVVWAKKLLQKLLTPVLERQSAYNAANARVSAQLWEQAGTWRQQQATALQA